jgi:hypothetical protein
MNATDMWLIDFTFTMGSDDTVVFFFFIITLEPTVE